MQLATLLCIKPEWHQKNDIIIENRHWFFIFHQNCNWLCCLYCTTFDLFVSILCFDLHFWNIFFSNVRWFDKQYWKCHDYVFCQIIKCTTTDTLYEYELIHFSIFDAYKLNCCHLYNFSIDIYFKCANKKQTYSYLKYCIMIEQRTWRWFHSLAKWSCCSWVKHAFMLNVLILTALMKVFGQLV